MADKRVFEFEVDGLVESIENFATLEEVVENAAKGFESFDDSVSAGNDALKDGAKDAKKFAESVDKASDKAEKSVEGLNVELINSNERLEALQRLTDGIAGTFAGATASVVAFTGENEALQKLNERVGALAQTLGGVVSLTSAFEKENRKAIASLIAGYGKSLRAAKAFATSTRGALISTGIGALVVAVGLLVANFDKVRGAASRAASSVANFLDNTIPGFAKIRESATAFVAQIGGFKQAFAGAFAAAKQFFSAIGESFVALLRGDLQRVKEVFSNIGVESAEAFSEGVQAKQKELDEQIAKERIAAEIATNARLIAERQAAGKDTFELEKQNLQNRIAIAEQGSEELLDLESELRVLILSRRKAAQDEQIKQQQQLSEAQKAEAERIAAEEAARAEAEAERAIEIAERRSTALFELEQLIRNERLQSLEAQEQQSIEIINQAAEVRREILQAELQNQLEDEALIEEERILIVEQFRLQEIEIETARVEALAALEDAQTKKAAEAEAERAKADEKAKQEQLARDKAISDAQQQIQDNRIANARATVQFLGQIAKEGSALQKAAFAVDKAIAVAEILVNLQKELAAIAASNAGLGPAAPAVVAALQAQAGVRAALGVASVVATSIKFRNGGIVQGASHEAGGVKGTGRFSNIEVEGGEFVVNKAATRRFLPQLKAINSFKMQQGGQLPDFATINESVSVVDSFNSALLDEIRAINSAPVVVSVEEINSVQNRVAQIRENASI